MHVARDQPEKFPERVTYRTVDGYDLARILSEKERYQAMSSRLQFTPILECEVRSTGISIEFSLPSHATCVADGALELSDPLCEAVLRRLLDVEEEVPGLWKSLAASSVFVRQSGEVWLHAPLIGWHIPNLDNDRRWVLEIVPSRCRTALEADLERIQTFKDLVAAMAAGGWDPEALELGVEGRLAWHRRAGVDSLGSDPGLALEHFKRALEIQPTDAIVLSGLEAAISLGNRDSFDQVRAFSRHEVKGGDEELLALDAWRAEQSGDLELAEALAQRALTARCRRELALDVLERCAVARGDTHVAYQHARQALLEHPSAARLRDALKYANAAQDIDGAWEMIEAYPLPVEDAVVHSIAADIAIRKQRHGRALARIHAAAQLVHKPTDSQVQHLLKLCDRACHALSSGERVERFLEILGVLRLAEQTPLLDVEYARYLLAGNLHDEFELVLRTLDQESSDALHLSSIYAFRRGEYGSCIARGIAALNGGIFDPDLVCSVVAACVQETNATAFLQVVKLSLAIAEEYPEVAECIRKASRELNCDEE